MALFDEKTKKALVDALSGMKDKVKLAFFTQEVECPSCSLNDEFVHEIAELSDKIELDVYDFAKDKEKADEFGIDKVPAIVVLDKDGNYLGIRFYGLPGGYEINSFISALIEVSGAGEKLPDDIMQRIKAIDKKIHIQVFISLSCPYCPDAVIVAHKIALEAKRGLVSADMVEATTFTPLAIKYNVRGVPKIVINEDYELLGAQPINAFLDIIENIK